MMGRDRTGDPVATSYSIRAVERVCDLVELLQDAPYGVSLVQAAEITGLPRATAFRYLQTLEARGWVTRMPLSKSYRPGEAFPTRPEAHRRRPETRSR